MSQLFRLKNGTVLLSTEAPGGIYNSGQLRKIAELCSKELAIVKATEDQRLALFVKESEVNAVAQQLRAMGLGFRHYQDSLHQPVSCLGELCEEHEQPAMATAMEITKEIAAIQLNASLKIGVNGCARCCTPCHTLDIAVVGDAAGYRISLGGKTQQMPEFASYFAEGVPPSELPKRLKAVIETYKKLAEDGETLHAVIERCGVADFVQALAPYSQDAAGRTDPFAEDAEPRDAAAAEELDFEDADLSIVAENETESDAGLDEIPIVQGNEGSLEDDLDLTGDMPENLEIDDSAHIPEDDIDLDVAANENADLEDVSADLAGENAAGVAVENVDSELESDAVLTADEDVLDFSNDESGLEDASLEASALGESGLDASDLDESSLDAASLDESGLDEAALDASSLDDVSLEESDLDASGLDVASLEDASLDESALDASSLEDSSVDVSALDESVLNESSLDDSGLDESALDASSLDESGLESSLDDSGVNDTSLDDVNLDFAADESVSLEEEETAEVAEDASLLDDSADADLTEDLDDSALVAEAPVDEDLEGLPELDEDLALEEPAAVMAPAPAKKPVAETMEDFGDEDLPGDVPDLSDEEESQFEEKLHASIDEESRLIAKADKDPNVGDREAALNFLEHSEDSSELELSDDADISADLDIPDDLELETIGESSETSELSEDLELETIEESSETVELETIEESSEALELSEDVDDALEPLDDEVEVLANADEELEPIHEAMEEFPEPAPRDLAHIKGRQLGQKLQGSKARPQFKVNAISFQDEHMRVTFESGAYVDFELSALGHGEERSFRLGEQNVSVTSTSEGYILEVDGMRLFHPKSSLPAAS